MKRRYQALAVIYRFIRTHGYSPSMREIAGRLGIRASSVALGYCRRLKDEGLLDYVPKVNRTVHLTPAGEAYLQDASTAHLQARGEALDPVGLSDTGVPWEEPLERKNGPIIIRSKLSL